MTTTRGIRSLVAAGILLAALTSCSDDGSEPSGSPSPGPTSASSSPTATSSSAEPSLAPSEKAAEDAAAMVREYYATIDLLRQDASRPASDLKSVASGTELLVQRNLLTGEREKGHRAVGEVKLVEVTVQSVSLDAPVTALVDVCWDVTDADVVNRDGKSMVSAERTDVGWTRFTVTNKAWKKTPSAGWRVTGGYDLKKAPCAGS